MNSKDIFLSLLIVIILIVIILLNFSSIGIKNIQNNWPAYRCNPLIMPFASMFGHDAEKNFTHCIQTTQTNYLGYLMQPLNYSLSLVNSSGNILSEAINSARAFISNLRGFIADIVTNVFGVFLNMLIEFQRISVDIKDMVGKMVGIMTTLLFTLDGSVKTMESVWAGPPGQSVRALRNVCFSPDTVLELENGKKYTMSQIPLNSVLKGGSVVQSIMKISNVKQNGELRENIYSISGGVYGDNILVTGSHLIYDEKTNQFVPVEELDSDDVRLTSIEMRELACLITSDHKIRIGKWIFHDWEDDNGSPSKTLEL